MHHENRAQLLLRLKQICADRGFKILRFMHDRSMTGCITFLKRRTRMIKLLDINLD